MKGEILMKKISTAIALVSILMNTNGEIFVNVQDNVYPETAIIAEVNRSEDKVTAEDFNGNQWEFYGAEDWMVGDICSMIMDGKGTDSIYDDEIIAVKYSGYLATENPTGNEPSEDELFKEYLEEIKNGNYDE